MSQSAAVRRRTFLTLLAGAGVVAAGLLVAIRLSPGGELGYGLDDVYIHLELARNLAHEGTFGLEPGQYESASSSPAWQFALLPFVLMVPSAAWAPLVVNGAAAVWLLWQLRVVPVLQRLAAGDLVPRLSVAVVPVALGLVPLVIAGMEHTLHAAVAVAILLRVAALLGVPSRPPDLAPYRWGLAGVAGLLAVATLIRFETAFLAAGCAVAFLVVRRPRAAVVSLAASALPVVAFAVVNTAFGQYPLPNSVVAKSPVGDGLPVPDLAEALGRAFDDLLLLGVAMALVVLAVTVARSSQDSDRGVLACLLIPLTAIVGQLLYGDIGWFERYQAWLLALGVTTLLLTAGPVVEHNPDREPESGRSAFTGIPLLAVLLLLATALRYPVHLNTPVAVRNIQQNQEQLGRFLAATYPGEAVIVNDIGWVAWLHEGPLVDIYGLGSVDVLRARKEGRLTATFVAETAQAVGSEVMAIYEEPFANLVPDGWERAGSWCVTSARYVLSSDCVSFYAPPGPPSERLLGALDVWAPDLPAGVEWQPHRPRSE